MIVKKQVYLTYNKMSFQKIQHKKQISRFQSGNVMNCHATAPGSIPGRDGVFTELHVLRKGQ